MTFILIRKSLTHVLVCLEVVRVAKMLVDGLAATECAHGARWGCESVRTRECLLADAEFLEPNTVDVGCKVGELAESVMCIAVERVDEDAVIELPSEVAKLAIEKGDPVRTANVNSRALILAEHAHHALLRRKAVFRSVQMVSAVLTVRSARTYCSPVRYMSAMERLKPCRQKAANMPVSPKQPHARAVASGFIFFHLSRQTPSLSSSGYAYPSAHYITYMQKTNSHLDALIPVA